MAETIRELLGAAADALTNTCRTGKTGYRTKDEARRALRGINTRERTAMGAFRCGWCDQYHIGHKRGAVL